MRYAVVGAGAIGAFIGARLWAAGNEVTFIDRGERLESMRAHGLRVVEPDGRTLIMDAPRAMAFAHRPGEHDVVLLAVKAPQLAAVAADLMQLCHRDTVIVPLQNGLPWWYFQRHGGEFDGRRLQALDPDGVLTAGIDAQDLIGCVVYPAAEVVAPGHVRVVEGNALALGALNGTGDTRVDALAAELMAARFKVSVMPDIRNEIWLKLWGNLSFNPISALTGTTMADICDCAPTRQLVADMMREAQAVATRLGVSFRVDIERRIAGAARVGAHKTSMLQDVEAGRGTEVEAMLGAVIEVAGWVNVDTPCLRAVYACMRLLDARMVRTARELADAVTTSRVA